MFGSVIAGGQLVGTAVADPNNDAVAKLNELSRQAEATAEAANSAKIDLAAKLAAQRDAERAVAADEAVVTAAKTTVSTFQVDIDKAAVAAYMGGNTSGYNAVLTADSPQNLIDQMSAQDMVGSNLRARMDSYRAALKSATDAEQRSRDTADKARQAADDAKNLRAGLQAKQSQLQLQIASVKSQYGVLTPQQRAALAAPAPVPPVARPLPNPDADPDNPDAGPMMQAAAAAPLPEAAIGGGGGSSVGASAVAAALTRIGSPYVWGAAGPNAFDCSGLVMWAFGQQGVSLPHSSQALARGGTPVAMSDIQPGDLITYYGDASHVGIYIGDGMMVHASTFGQPVLVAPMNNAPIHNVRRY